MLVSEWDFQLTKKKPNTCFCPFKYLGININNTNCMHEETKLHLKSANKAYFAMVSLFKSKLLSGKTKKKLYTIYLKPVATYGCNTWATTEGDYN
jgi:hypothetical protein